MKSKSTSTQGNLRDLAGNCTMRNAANVSMSIADAIQNSPDRGARLLGLACAFVLALEVSGIQATDLMGYAHNCMNLAEGRRPEFAAVETYITKEIFANG